MQRTGSELIQVSIGGNEIREAPTEYKAKRPDLPVPLEHAALVFARHWKDSDVRNVVTGLANVLETGDARTRRHEALGVVILLGLCVFAWAWPIIQAHDLKAAVDAPPSGIRCGGRGRATEEGGSNDCAARRGTERRRPGRGPESRRRGGDFTAAGGVANELVEITDKKGTIGR